MTTTIHCPDLDDFFFVKRELIAYGYTYIENQTIAPSRGSNYIKVDDTGLFALISKQDFEQLNNK